MIFLNYQNYKIGKLDFIDNEFIYNSLPDEKLALQNCVGLIDYDLENSKDRKQNTLFAFFVNNFIENIKDREDIIQKFNANDLNCYEILEKLSTINLDKFSFWLSK